jgi:hypothetical protein
VNRPQASKRYECRAAGFHRVYPGLCNRAFLDTVVDSHLVACNQIHPEKYKNLIPTFMTILEQVFTNKLPRSFDYHGSPAPWIQLGCLRILSILSGAHTR